MSVADNKLNTTATGAAALAVTLNADRPIVLEEVRLHLSAVGGAAESFTVQIDHSSGAAYDVVLASQDMNAITDYVWRPAGGASINTLDEVDFAWANSNNKTWSLEIIYRYAI